MTKPLTREVILAKLGQLMNDAGLIEDPPPPDLGTMPLSEFPSIERFNLYFRIEQEWQFTFLVEKHRLEDALLLYTISDGEEGVESPTVNDLATAVLKEKNPGTA